MVTAPDDPARPPQTEAASSVNVAAEAGESPASTTTGNTRKPIRNCRIISSRFFHYQ
jgi:hypothetical protein